MNDNEARESPVAESAVAQALAMGAAGRERADAFLDAQTAVAKLQKEHLHEQRALLVSHLKWRRFNDRMHGAVQILFALIGLVVLAGLALLLWNASHADGLEVGSFTSPPGFAQRGIGGDILAADMTVRLGDIRALAMSRSFSSSTGVSSDRNDIKLEIPETGISISEAWRLIRGWLGRERHVTGSLREADGRIVLSASLDGLGAATASGTPAELPALEERVAEQVFGLVDPVNYVVYLTSRYRHREAYAAAASYAQIARGPARRADAFGLFAYTTAFATGDYGLALQRLRFGIDIDPKLAVIRVLAMRYDRRLGHDEPAIAQARAVANLIDADQLPRQHGVGFARMKAQARSTLALLTGDFADAAGFECGHMCDGRFEQFSQAEMQARRHDPVGALKLIQAGRVAGVSDPAAEAEARYYIAAAKQEWTDARAAATTAEKLALVPTGDESPLAGLIIARDGYHPLIAEADAHLGNFAPARAEIAGTQADCVPCTVVRGDIDALDRKYDGAAYWYGRAAALAPSVPFAETQWGAMLLRRGDYSAAVAKFAAANRTGPHFADPLEMWGEALIGKHRSDLALAKFAEADKYAPNWGRMHLEWGKALLWSGDKAGAKKQFWIASHLDLNATDAANLKKQMVTL